jgi:hypothetical protein
MELSKVKLGTPIIYSINGHEYTGVALGSVSVGYNHARVAAGHHVNLIYLNEQGSPIKIFGASLLSEVTTDDHLDAQLDVEEKVLGDRDKAVAAIEARDVQIGWKPYVPAVSGCDEALKMMAEHAADVAKERDEAKAMVAGLQSEVKDLTAQLLALKGQPSAADLDKVAEEQKAADATDGQESEQQ